MVDGDPVIIIIISGGGYDATVRIWDARTGQARGQPLTGHTSTVGAVAFGAIDGDPVIVSSSSDRTMRVWDARTGRPRGQPLTGHTDTVVAVAFAVVNQDPVIVSGSSDGTVWLWDARSMSLLSVIPAIVEVNAVTIVPDGVAVAAGSSILVVDVPGLQPQPLTA